MKVQRQARTSPGLDWSGRDFADIMRRLDSSYPISDRYERLYLPGDHWWSSQRQHMVGWFSELSSPGAYGRTRPITARVAYNRFQCAPGLLWLSEGVGVDHQTVTMAADLAGGRGRPATQCAAIRRVIPWSMVSELAAKIDRRRIIHQ